MNPKVLKLRSLKQMSVTSLVIDTNFAILLVCVALLVFAILNVIEAQKTSPNVQQQKSYGIIMIALSAFVFLVFLYAWMPPTEALETLGLGSPVEVPVVETVIVQPVIEVPKLSWNEALLKQWQSSGQQIWPKKGSPEYSEVLKIMG